MHAVADLPPGYDEADVVASAARHGVSVDGLGHYAADERDARPGIVIGYGRPAEHAFSTAVSRLCAALADQEQD